GCFCVLMWVPLGRKRANRSSSLHRELAASTCLRQNALMEPEEEVTIWNRATLNLPETSLARGDVALRDLLRVHGMIQSGGMAHCVDVFSVDELNRGIAGFRFFGLDAEADLVQEATALIQRDLADPQLDAAFESLDDRYSRE